MSNSINPHLVSVCCEAFAELLASEVSFSNFRCSCMTPNAQGHWQKASGQTIIPGRQIAHPKQMTRTVAQRWTNSSGEEFSRPVPKRDYVEPTDKIWLNFQYIPIPSVFIVDEASHKEWMELYHTIWHAHFAKSASH